jgi:hypothetical protein
MYFFSVGDSRRFSPAKELSLVNWYKTPGKEQPKREKDQGKKELIRNPIIRSFIRDEDIVGMALGPSGTGDPDKAGPGMHLIDRP